MKKIIIFSCFFIASSKSIGQVSVNNSLFFQKGIVISDADLTKLNDAEAKAILSYDFAMHRNEKSLRDVQIKDGPPVKLMSLDEVQKLGIAVDGSILDLKRGEDLNNANLRPLITLIDIGFKYANSLAKPASERMGNE